MSLKRRMSFPGRVCTLWVLGTLLFGYCLNCEKPLALGREIVELGSSETPPFWSANLANDGMCGEILHAISANSGITSKIVFYPTKRLIRMKTGNHVGDPEHWPDQKFEAVIPIATFCSSFYYYKPNHEKAIVFKDLGDLKGFTIGVIKRSIEDTSFFESRGIRIEESYKQESLFKKLKLGRIDLCGMVDLSGIVILNSLFPDEKGNFARIPLPRSVSAICIMIDADYPNAKQIADQYRAGLDTVVANGTYRSILQKYYGPNNVPKDWFVQLLRFRAQYEKKTPTVSDR